MQKCLWVMALAAVVAAAGCDKSGKTAAAKHDSAAAGAESGLEEMPQFSVGQVSTAPDKAVARVGNDKIMQSDVDKVVNMQLAQYGNQIPDAFREQAKAQMTPRVIDMLVAQRLLRADVAARKITADEAAVTARLEKISKNLPEGATLEQMLEYRGITREQMMKDVREGIQFEKLFDTVLEGKNVAPTDEEAQAFYDKHKDEYFAQKEQVKASHILITPETEDDKGWNAAKEKIDAVAKELAEGADFAEMAKKYSSCPSKEQGGDLGEFERGRMVPEFEEAAFTQELNVVGSPVKTQFGYHLIKVVDKSDGGVTPFAEVKEKIVESLSEEAKSKLVEYYIDDLKAKADVEIFKATNNEEVATATADEAEDDEEPATAAPAAVDGE